jgi:arginine deiminase
MTIQVSSETALLEHVIVHTPGKEVSLVNPDDKDLLLFDDIIYEAAAREEHEHMLKIFEVVIGSSEKIVQITDLIKQVFSQEEARGYYVQLLLQEYASHRLDSKERLLLSLDPEELLSFSLLGISPHLPGIQLLPSPNILFTRDLAAVVNKGIILSRAARKARIRESLLMDTVVEFHPIFQSVKQQAVRLHNNDSIEGGDIIVPNSELVLIGMSERTSFSGIMKAAKAILNFGVKTVLIVDIPKQRSSMHLDTIFTFSNHNECVVYPPAITEVTNNVVCLTKGANDTFETRLMTDLKSALTEFHERDLIFIQCGGNDINTQRREQWTDGANVFALAPGVIVGYERNTHTFNALAEHGYEVLKQADFIDQFKHTAYKHNPSEKFAISFTGNELCRGRGGARCMTLPISRR